MRSGSSDTKPEPETRLGRGPLVHPVPGLTHDEIASAAENAFKRHLHDSSLPSAPKRAAGDGVAIVWFRNDLRILDNEALMRAWAGSAAVLPVYCVDPRCFGATTRSFNFPKTGPLRAKFLMECLSDLKKNLTKRGLNLLIRSGKPEDILPSLAKAFGAHTVFAHKETCSEEILVERLVARGLRRVVLEQGGSSEQSRPKSPTLRLIWGATMYHIDDLPFGAESVPDVYTQFRKAVESKCSVRRCFKLPMSLGPPPSKEMEEDLLRVYKETRNGMLGPDYSTKFSPWLASGSLSPRYVYEEVRRYEERIANDSTYWVLFELIWRDYFRFISIKYGNSIFHLGGPRKVVSRWSQDHSLFDSWREGRTGCWQ